MLSMGLVVALPTAARPVVRAVLLDDTRSRAETPSLSEVVLANEFDLTTAETEWARIASQFYQDVSGRLATFRPDRVVIRAADSHHNRRLTTGVSLRLYVEGAISAAARAHVADVHFRTGSGCATAYGQDKSILDSDASGIGAKAVHLEAAVAALSALFTDRV